MAAALSAHCFLWRGAGILPLLPFRGLFSGNIKLTDARNLLLPATTQKEGCYQSMFQGCASLTETPELPAEVLKEGCYKGMFQDCESLESVTCLATPGMGTFTKDWMSGVAGTGTFTKAAGVEWPSGADGIPEGWYVEDYEE